MGWIPGKFGNTTVPFLFLSICWPLGEVAVGDPEGSTGKGGGGTSSRGVMGEGGSCTAGGTSHGALREEDATGGTTAGGSSDRVGTLAALVKCFSLFLADLLLKNIHLSNNQAIRK
jgi:hypothetical protein